MHMKTLIALSAGLLLLTACFEDSKEEILTKTENVGDKAGLRTALGDPDDIDKVGPLETWTYKASNGAVAFILAGDVLTLRKTEEKSE